jgi:hypothetical protein
MSKPKKKAKKASRARQSKPPKPKRMTKVVTTTSKTVTTVGNPGEHWAAVSTPPSGPLRFDVGDRVRFTSMWNIPGKPPILAGEERTIVEVIPVKEGRRRTRKVTYRLDTGEYVHPHAQYMLDYADTSFRENPVHNQGRTVFIDGYRIEEDDGDFVAWVLMPDGREKKIVAPTPHQVVAIAKHYKAYATNPTPADRLDDLVHPVSR